MTAKFIIKGPTPLSGIIDVRGSKNAVLPVLAATLLTDKRCRIRNVPLVSDIYLMLDMLLGMGSKIVWADRRTVEVENKNIDPKQLSKDIVKRMRASILLVGPLLARFGKVEEMRYPGGCSIGARPIDVHLNAFADLGANVALGKNSFSVFLEDHQKISQVVILSEFSVTATENLMIFLSAVPNPNKIRIAASEPHVVDLAKFLGKLGAKIKGAGSSAIEIVGSNNLTGANHTIIPDYIEAGTFLLMNLAVGGEIEIRNAPLAHLDLVLKKLTSNGADISIDARRCIIQVRARPYGLTSNGRRMSLDQIQTMPYPGIPTDLQSAFAVFATQTFGKTLIHDPMYEKRMECVKELAEMGAKIEILDPHRAFVYGPTRLKGNEVSSSDLRGGAALIAAGLAAYGTTIVNGAEHVERGYEDLDGRLRALGADIKKVA